MALCLVVEDDIHQQRIVVATLRNLGYETATAGSGEDALAACRRHRPEIVLLDLGLPDVDGLELIPRVLALVPLARIVVTTGLESVRAAVSALRAGACHYLVKPWELDELALVLEREARAENRAESSCRAEQGEVFWGRHPELARLQRRLERLAAAHLTPVLLSGETGTGKEVLARELHRMTRAGGVFVPVNCAAIPAELLESELFGHERGAFTGADARRRGLVELAREGTLFLDEVGEMPALLQAKLLRFLEGHRFRRVGGEEELSSPCRVIAATHRDLDALQRSGQFREDLFFRLAVVRLHVPPLRERRDDLIALANFVLPRLAAALGRAPLPLSLRAEAAVLAHPWPGNVRELRNRFERALVLAEGDRIEPEDLDLGAAGASADRVGEKERCAAALAAEHGNVSRAASRLGVPRHWLRYRMMKFRLPGDG